MSDMIMFEPARLPAPFGLGNTGSICYLNASLQALASCTALSRVLEEAPPAELTATGAALAKFLRIARGSSIASIASSANVASESAAILGALRADLASRRPRTRFGSGQESASEAFVLILEMLLRDDDKAQPANCAVSQLFAHRYRCTVVCGACRRAVSRDVDENVHFSLFHFDGLEPSAFAAALARHVSVLEDYVCPECKQRGSAIRRYDLTMAPEILVCLFNAYVGRGGAKIPRRFPETFELPARAGGAIGYRLVAQIEHSGGLDGGHYWARCLRLSGGVAQAFMLNDAGVSPAAFGASAETYVVVYHVCG